MNIIFVIFKKAKHKFHNADVIKTWTKAIIYMHWNFRLYWIDSRKYNWIGNSLLILFVMIFCWIAIYQL